MIMFYRLNDQAEPLSKLPWKNEEEKYKIIDKKGVQQQNVVGTVEKDEAKNKEERIKNKLKKSLKSDSTSKQGFQKKPSNLQTRKNK